MWNEIFVLDSPELWKGVAFFVSVGLIVLPVYRLLLKVVKARAKQIASHLEEALKLRREAEDMLKSTQHKDFHKETERKQIMQLALKNARVLKEGATADLGARMLRREKENEERVCLIRENGLKELREKVLEIAVDTTENILAEKVDESSQKMLMRESLNDLERVLKNPQEVKQLRKMIEQES